MVGALGRTLDHAFAKSADITEGTCGKKTKLNLADEFKLFIKILHPEQLFKNIPRREFSSFPAFQYATSEIQPKRLQSKLMQLSKRLDRIKRYCE
jgi:thiamine pyrophosphokinase